MNELRTQLQLAPMISELVECSTLRIFPAFFFRGQPMRLLPTVDRAVILVS